MVRRLMSEFGDDLQFTYVMGGLAREWSAAEHAALITTWLEEAERWLITLVGALASQGYRRQESQL